ncbi:hypothetical protein Daus18300_011323 [Diaporthe australafricana]|uniref:Amidase domain-containing protein n=1 Tax=Diaporthe australafricana TaxID=127596 RepID=A0ABR3W6U2_9PEZI
MAHVQRPFASKTVDIVTATAGKLRQLLDAGTISSEDLVRLYLDQIAKHNYDGMKLHAITAIAPSEKLLAKARALDQERRTSGPRSSLHGIPITVKDLFLAPSFDLEVTCGSFALKRLNASEDAAVVTSLADAGCIIIGLANLTEWANCRGPMTSGWSAIGDLTQSPCVRGGVDPNDKWMGHSTTAGSSSGSAVGTAAGFSTLSVGSEADGSIVQPAETAMLKTLKKVESLGGKVAYNESLLMPAKAMDEYKTAPMGDIFNRETVSSFNRFLALFDSSELRTLEDLIEFNKRNAELEFPPFAPDQSKFEAGLTDKMTDEEYETGLKQLRKSFRDAIEKCFEATGADVIMASGQTFLPTMAAAAGYLLASVPVGFASYNGRPYGMEIMARNHEKEKIFKDMSAWEASFPRGRQAPPQLIDWEKEPHL